MSDEKLRDRAFYADCISRPLDDPTLPIGVFDSGLGGLTVVRHLVSRLPGESVLYFGDTARVPYGTRSSEAIRHYAREAAHILLCRGVKALVIACNTATAHALETLLEESPVPVIGVVGPGARAAHAATRSGHIGVIGTPGTIASGAYDREVRKLRPHVRFFAQSCPLFVPLAEEGMADHEATELVAREYLKPFQTVDIDTLILGCTHYPVLRDVIGRIMGPGVTLVDAAEETVTEVENLLDGRGLRNPSPSEVTRRFLVSDLPLRFRTVARQFVGELVERVERVEIEGCLDRVPV